MRSSSGEHYVGLDHIRAFAAFCVFAFHFLTVNDSIHHPLDGTFSFPLNSLFAEGQTGVAIFMVLSGYLFARLTAGRDIRWTGFLWNRFVRLAPLLIVVLLAFPVAWALTGQWDRVARYPWKLAQGLVLPVWFNGGWSVTAELHFYLLLPMILLLERRRPFAALTLVALALAVRWAILEAHGGESLRQAAYYTILGRIDQFVLGVLFWRHGRFMAGRHVVAAALITLWVVLWQGHDRIGGGFDNRDYPAVWLLLGTAEGLFYGALISWYDRSFRFGMTGVSGLIARIGAWSYSIYLLHEFVVRRMAAAIDAHLVPLDNFYVAFAFAALCFVPVCAMGWASYTWFETRFLRLRVPYTAEGHAARASSHG